MSQQDERDAWTKHVTKQQIQKSLAGAKRSKYGAVKKTVNGIEFHSTKEADRYLELAMLQAAKKITGLRLQTKWPLLVTCAKSPRQSGPEILWPIGDYISDFDYFENSRQVVEDVKGMKTPLYRWKKKHFETQYDLRIRET